MTPGESEFVEEMGQFLASLGMTPMAGRMWGWLLICEPPEQTAAEIAEALHASRGAISGTARLLANAGLVRRARDPEDKRGVITELTDEGLALLEKAAPTHVEGVREHLIDLLSPEEQATIAAAFERVHAHLLEGEH